jgi:tetratricopeptide (TPR) repeat protein
MKREGAKVCPACGARNKAKWELCVSCGESLDAVPISTDDGAAAAVVEDAEVPSSSLGAWLSLAAMGGIVALVVIWVANRPAPTETPVNPGAFTLGTVPPSAPPARPAETSDLAKTMDGARRLIARGDAAGAARLLAPLVGDNSGNAELRRLYGQALLALGSREDALREFQAAAQAAGGDAEYQLAVAGTLATMGRSEEAVAEYRQLLSNSPSHAQALHELGTLLTRMRRFDVAVAPLTQAAGLRPNDMVLLQDLAYAQESAGQTDAAKASYQKLLTTAPDATLARSRLADIVFRQGDREQALAMLDDGLKRDPNAPLLRRTRAAALERMDRIEEAIAEYRAYAKIAPDVEDARVLTDRANMLERRLRGSS